MFGTVRPFQPELKRRESADYRAVYCGVCHALAGRYGKRSRWLANYDFVLPAMLYGRGDCRYGAKRCLRHPFRKQRVCVDGAAADYAADALMLFSDWVLRDTIRDEKGFRRLFARFLRLVYRKPFRKAAGRLPSEADVCALRMDELWRLEEANDGSLEAPAGAFGGMLACLASGAGETERRAAGSLMKHLGRWIYIADALEDADKDGKKGAYNAVTASGMGRDEVFARLAEEQRLLLEAFDLLPDNGFSGITRNILTLGLVSRGNEVYKGGSAVDKRSV